MTNGTPALLSDRGVVRVRGEDAEKLLQGIVTGDMDRLRSQPALFAALLSPQGKVLFEFFVVRSDDGFLLETARDQAAGLVQRLAMYKLRAKADVHDVSAEHRVMAALGNPAQDSGGSEGAISFPDPRLPELGSRMLARAQSAAGAAPADGSSNSAAEAYHARRILLGVPEGGKDYAFGDTFPHEANFDLLNGVSFSKGCFVGQEVVSRMQHRGTARKRIMIVEAEGPLEAGSEIKAGESAVVGMVGSAIDGQGLALVRRDRVQEADSKGKALTVAGVVVKIRAPDYMRDAEAQAGSHAN